MVRGYTERLACCSDLVETNLCLCKFEHDHSLDLEHRNVCSLLFCMKIFCQGGGGGRFQA